MVKSMFSGISGLRAHQQKMDVIGNNIANINTFGFKAGRVTFKESIYQTSSASSNGSEILGGRNPSQLGYGSQVGTVDILFASGSYAPTDSSTDCMIDGQGFFILGPKMDPEDATQRNEIDISGDADEIHLAMTAITLSRVGNFVFDGEGYLVDGGGNVVYGYDIDETTGVPITETLVPIRKPLDEDDGKPENMSNIKITSNGEIIGTKDDGTVITFAKLALANVPNPAALEKTQGPYYRIGANTGEIAPFEPTKGTTGKIEAYGLEMANVDLAKEFSEMITTQRGFQANSKIITVTDEMLQELVNIKR